MANGDQSDAWTQLKNRYGLNDTQIQNLQQAGYTDVNALMQGGQGSLPILLARFSGGGGGITGGQQQTAPVNVGGVDPNQTITNLGAAALQERASYAPVPGADTSAISGVSKATAGYTSDVVPNVQRGPWTQVPGMFVSATGQVTPGTQIAPMPKLGQAPQQQQPTYRGPTTLTMPSVFQPPQPTAGIPFTPAKQPTGVPYMPGQSWATAQPPPAPGQFQPIAQPNVAALPGGMPPPGQGGFDAAHTSALANAGMSLYAHYGGDPSTATVGDIATFHNELRGAIAGGKPIKMRSGGYVSGQPGPDQVPAMLTSGEYVLNKNAVQDIGVGKLNAMNRRGFQEGGSVDDDLQPTPESDTAAVTAQGKSYQATAPPEARRRIITAGGGRRQSPPAAPGSTGMTSAQDYANWANAQPVRGGGQPGTAAAGGGYASSTPESGSYYVGGSPGAGQSGYIYPSQQAATAAGDVGAGPGGAAGPSGSQLSGVIGDLASGLTKAAQTYANSIKPWTWLKSAIPNPPSGGGQQPAAKFTQAEAQPPSRQQQTISPYSPYYPYGEV